MSKNLKGGKKVVFANAPLSNQETSSKNIKLQRKNNTVNTNPSHPSPPVHLNQRWTSPKFNNKWRRSDNTNSPLNQTKNQQKHQDRERPSQIRNQHLRHLSPPNLPPSSTSPGYLNHQVSHNQHQRIQNNNRGYNSDRNHHHNNNQVNKKKRRRQNHQNHQGRDRRDE